MCALFNYLHRYDEFTVNILKEASKRILSPLAFAPRPPLSERLAGGLTSPAVHQRGLGHLKSERAPRARQSSTHFQQLARSKSFHGNHVDNSQVIPLRERRYK